jgi:hypothetical protein
VSSSAAFAWEIPAAFNFPRDDKGYDMGDFVAQLRVRNVTPHVAMNTTNRRSAFDQRTARHDTVAVIELVGSLPWDLQRSIWFELET